jgi:hypothetical protein
MIPAKVSGIGVSLLVLSAVGCTHVGTVKDARAYMLDRPASHVWVVGPDNQLVELKHARVLDDTLSGFAGSSYYEVAMSDVKRLQAKVPDHGATVMLAGGVAVATGLVIAELTSTGSKAGCEVLVGGTQTQLFPGGPLISQGVYAPCPPAP